MDQQVGRKKQKAEKPEDIDTVLSKFDRPDAKKRVLRDWCLPSLHSRAIDAKIKEMKLTQENTNRAKELMVSLEEKKESLESDVEKGTMEDRMYVLLINWGLDMAVAAKEGSFKSIARVLASVVAITERL